jgi:uncharacterized protein (TIGR03435 family)
VKSAKDSDPLKWKGGPGTGDPGNFEATVDLHWLARIAWDVRRYQIVAPKSLEETHVTIAAKVPAGTDQEAFHRMLQQLLLTRMKVVARYERKEVSAYDLVIAKGGAKLQEAEAAPSREQDQPAPPGQPPVVQIIRDKDGRPQMPPGRPRFLVQPASSHTTRYMVRMMPLESILPTLADAVGRPVVNKTGLTGNFDFVLEFAWALSAESVAPDPTGASPDTHVEAPPLKEALEQQLGLKLQPSKVVDRVLTITSFNKAPVEN